MLKKGPHNSLAVFQLQTLVQRFLEIWSNEKIFDNEVNSDLIAREMLPVIEQEIQEKVDQIIKRELDNYYFKLNIAKRKEKKAKKKRIKTKSKKIPGEKFVHAKNPIDLLPSVIETSILTTNEPIRMDDYIGSDNMIR